MSCGPCEVSAWSSAGDDTPDIASCTEPSMEEGEDAPTVFLRLGS